PAGRWCAGGIARGLAARLGERHAAQPHVRVLVGDVLELPLDTLVAEPDVTVVANLPYNISTPVLFRLRALRARFPRAVVMLQREVAERLAAGPRPPRRGGRSRAAPPPVRGGRRVARAPPR